SRRAWLVAALLPLACARQAAPVRGRADRLVRGGRAGAVRDASPAARAGGGGDSPPDRSQGPRQDRPHARARAALTEPRAMELRVQEHGPHVVIVTIAHQT